MTKLERKARRNRRLYLHYKNAGLCTSCRCEKQRPGHFECEDCAAYRRMAYRNRRKIEIRKRIIFGQWLAEGRML